MTDKEIENIYDEHEKNVFKLFDCVPENLKWGQHIYTDCPRCGSKGKLYVSRAKCNGHLHIACENCKRQIIQ